MMLNSVAGHHYETRVADAFVVASNDALLSCSLPSFASEYLSVLAWVTSEGLEVSSSHLGGKPESQGNTTLRSIVDTRTLDSLSILPSFPSIFILFLFLFISCYFTVPSGFPALLRAEPGCPRDAVQQRHHGLHRPQPRS